MRGGQRVRPPSDRPVRRRLAVWLVGSAVGAAVVALPDGDDRVVSLSRTHGPSPVDALGVLVLLAVWVPVPALLWRRRAALRGRAAAAAGALAVVGLVGLVVTVGLDLGPVYLVPVTVLVVAQALGLHVVARRGR